MALCSVVLMVGLEPTLCFHKQILSLSCLPIPPHQHKYKSHRTFTYGSKDGICLANALPTVIFVFKFCMTNSLTFN